MLLTIEKMIYGGDGLARRSGDESARQKAVFVPFVLAGERVEAEIVEERPGFARARPTTWLERSPHRIEPGCPYFGRCGGCQYQHASYEHQLEIKQAVLRESLRRIAKVELAVDLRVHAAEPWGYRNRTRLKAQNGRLGYFAHGSHRFVPVDACPISSPLINRAIAALGGLAEFRPWARQIAEVEWFANHDDSALQAAFYSPNPPAAAKFGGCFEALQAALPELRGVLLAASNGEEEDLPSRQMKARPGVVDARAGRQQPPVVLGERWIEYATMHPNGPESVGDPAAAAAPLRASVGAFFQTNRFLIDELARVVTAGQMGRRALDLYAGVGLFARPLAASFDQLTAVEIAPAAVAALRENAEGRFEAVASTTEHFLRSIAGKKDAYDLIVVDPPRSGLGEQTAQALAALGSPRLTYVSCDPATLARDLRVLLGAGFHIREAHLFDLFPQTFHLETVLHLGKL